MKLSVKQIREFKSNASNIKVNNILPILSYIKFDKGSVTKNSLGSFLVQSIDCDETFLVDEKVLFSFINNTLSDTIDIKISEKKITISDGISTVYSPTDDVNIYPKNDTPDGKLIEFDDSVLAAVYIAINFLEEENIPSMKNHIFIGNGFVFGCGHSMGYSEPCDKSLPKISIKKDTAVAIGKLTNVSFSENDTYHFFSSGLLKYGFAKSEYPFHDLTPAFNIPTDAGLFTITDKSDFIRRNTMVLEMAKSPVSIVTIQPKKNKLIYKTDDSDYGTGAASEIDIMGVDDVDFNFNPALMNKLLKNCPSTSLTFHKVKQNYYVTGDSDFIALIAGMA